MLNEHFLSGWIKHNPSETALLSASDSSQEMSIRGGGENIFDFPILQGRDRVFWNLGIRGTVVYWMGLPRWQKG